MQEMQVLSLGWEDPLEKGIATSSSILDWRIPCIEETGRLQFMGLQKSQTQLSNWACTHTHTHFYISNSESVRIRFSWEWQKSSNHHVVSNMLWFSHVSTISESKWSRLPSWFCSKSLEQNFATDYYVLSRLLSFFHGPRQTTWHQNWQSKQLPLPTKSHGEGREEIKIYRISKITQTIQKATLRGKCLYMG